MSEKEAKLFLEQLNSQGIIVTYDESVKNDEVTGSNTENSSFYLKGSDARYFLYHADINNDGKNDYILCSVSGSGSFFDIDVVYQEKNGKEVDIFDEIKIPLRKLVRETQKEDYDLEEGFAFMNGSLKIEKENGKVLFTLEEVTRDYGPPEYKFNPPEGYKFLWKNGDIKLIEHYVGDKVYKQTNFDTIVTVLAETEIEDRKVELEKWTDKKMIESFSKVAITDKHIKKLYGDFKRTAVNPPKPGTYTEYHIKNAEESLVRVNKLGRRIHNLFLALSDKDFTKYGRLVGIMRDVLYIDWKHIPYAIKHNNGRDIYWYELHNEGIIEAKKEYSKIFYITN